MRAMFYDETARIVNAFKGLLKEWKIVEGGVLLIPQNANFDPFVVAKRPLGFSSDFKWVFSAPVTFSYSKGDPTLMHMKMKSLECSMEIRGLIRREYKFVENPLRKALFPFIPFDGGLAETLNADSRVRELLKKASPEELQVTCYYELLPGRSQVESMIEYSRRPEKLGWLITASKASYVEPVLPLVFRNMFYLFDAIGQLLKTFTSELFRSVETK